MEIHKDIKRIDPTLPVIIITAIGALETAVTAIKDGSYDYITKPWNNEKLIVIVTNNYNTGLRDVLFAHSVLKFGRQRPQSERQDRAWRRHRRRPPQHPCHDVDVYISKASIELCYEYTAL